METYYEIVHVASGLASCVSHLPTPTLLLSGPDLDPGLRPPRRRKENLGAWTQPGKGRLGLDPAAPVLAPTLGGKQAAVPKERYRLDSF